MKLLIIFIIIGTLAIGSFLYFKSKTPTSPPKAAISIQISNAPESTKTYQSKNLKLSLDIPYDFQIDEKFTTLILQKDSDKIIIGRSATNFDNLSNYLKDFDSKRTIEVKSEKLRNINNYNVSERIENFPVGPISQQKIYFIFTDGWVFTISTSSQSIYDDLDQIAQSFRYTP